MRSWQKTEEAQTQQQENPTEALSFPNRSCPIHHQHHKRIEKEEATPHTKSDHHPTRDAPSDAASSHQLSDACNSRSAKEAFLPVAAITKVARIFPHIPVMSDEVDSKGEVEESGEPEQPPLHEEEEDEIVESDVELEGEIVEPDNDPPQKMGDSSVEVTEENCVASQVAKGKAMEVMSEGNLEEAIEHLTRAILLDPTSALMYASRAAVYIKMKKPNAAIRDANAALGINSDSAKGYKSRGMAMAMLCKWEEAAQDLHVASYIDYDEEISAVLKKVLSNTHKIIQYSQN